jgi:hypothetical protein
LINVEDARLPELRKSFMLEVFPRLKEILGETYSWEWSVTFDYTIEVITPGPEYKETVTAIVKQWLPSGSKFVYGYRDKFNVVQRSNPVFPIESKSVNHPAHYGGDTTYEAIKVIEAWKLDFHLGNTIKYISRWDKKGNPLENLEKASWYLNRKIEELKHGKL